MCTFYMLIGQILIGQILGQIAGSDQYWDSVSTIDPREQSQEQLIVRSRTFDSKVTND